MFRFLQVLLLNAWRGMRRAKGTPALITAFAAVCVLFIGGNAAARASLQTAMHIVGLPVSMPAEATDSSGAGGGTSGSGQKKSDTTSTKKSGSQYAGSQSSTKGDGSVSTAAGAPAQSLTGTVSLNPLTITPTCSQGVQVYNVQYALLSFEQAPISAVNESWSWETRIDSGTNSGNSPINTSVHNAYVGGNTQIYAINPSDPSQPLVSAAANTNYAYSFRMDVTGPLAAQSPWVSVPQADSSTCT